ncbi:MAG: tetratricopeptide repeat protein [Acidobacteria bacterium]|nr:tetratricopeptide repeat protein [Acidobacteriota bacterium]
MAAWLWVVAALWMGQQDPANEGYEALKQKDYERAAAAFRRVLDAAPGRVDVRKQLAYTLLKMGETEAAREEFAGIVQQAPQDWHSALEYGYLCHETRQIAQARRVFEQVSRTGDADSRTAAAEAFRNIDRPLVEAITRWQKALEQNPGDFSAHLELARAAEQRDEARLAAGHYRRAWELRPVERSLLVDLGRAWKQAGEIEKANAAWLAASRGPQPRAAEQALELLPVRYPYASEFQQAIELDPAGIELRRELGFLYLAVNQPSEAETEFVKLLEIVPGDLLSMAQVGLLRLARNDVAGAMPLLEKVLQGKDPELARKVRDALNARPLQRRDSSQTTEPKSMGDRSYKAGNLKDALRFYHAAHEQTPADPGLQLKLGWTYNMLRQDEEAIRYFEMARSSPDPKQKAEADRAYRNLRPAVARFRTTVWLLPMFSSRWHEALTYGQIKTDLRIGNLPLRPYVSLRFAGDSQRAATGFDPRYLSEGSIITAAGLATRPWKGLAAWAEAGVEIRYRERPNSPRVGPDYRGGIFFAKGFGRRIHSPSPGLFFDMTEDVILLSRYRWDLLAYSQSRFGYTMPRLGPFAWQAVWNANFTADRNHEPWANFVDLGPGIRFRFRRMPPSMLWSVDFMKGKYTRESVLSRRAYTDVRAGVWYAVTH